MPAPREVDLLVKVARMYFEDGASQQEIAERVGVSRSNVSRVIASARAQGIVEIRINDPTGRDVELESALRDAFGLADVRVAVTGDTPPPLERVGRLAASWLQSAVADVQTLGVSWGTSLQAVIPALPKVRAAADLVVVPLVGGLSSVASQTTGEELVRRFAAALGAGHRYLHAPALLASAEAAEALRHEPSISEALAVARSVDIALVGIGSVTHGSSAALLEGLHLTTRQRSDFFRQSPVGDACARFFDHDGTPLGGEVDDRVIAISLDELRRIPLVAGVAAGASKVQGVLGALRGGLIDVLLCDAVLARSLLRARARKVQSTEPPRSLRDGPNSRQHQSTNGGQRG